MSDNSIRTVRFVGEQGAEDLYRCLETGRIYARQRCDGEYVRWLTTVKWRCGYEASSHMAPGLTIRAIDKNEQVLFEEKIVRTEGYCDTVAKKAAPFSDEAIKQQAQAVAKQAGLLTYEEWKAAMMAKAREHGFRGYADNWCYDAEYAPLRVLFPFEYLGMKAYCTAQDHVHRVSKQKWTCVEIRDYSKHTVLEICGYTMGGPISLVQPCF